MNAQLASLRALSSPTPRQSLRKESFKPDFFKVGIRISACSAIPIVLPRPSRAICESLIVSSEISSVTEMK